MGKNHWGWFLEYGEKLKCKKNPALRAKKNMGWKKAAGWIEPREACPSQMTKYGQKWRGKKGQKKPNMPKCAQNSPMAVPKSVAPSHFIGA